MILTDTSNTPPILKLPLELIEQICEEHPRMILPLRQTSRELNRRMENGFVKYWFAEVAVVPEIDSMGELLKISQMPRLRVGVKNLVFSTISHTLIDTDYAMSEEQWIWIRSGDFRRMLTRILKNLTNCTTVSFKPTDSFLARSLFEDTPDCDPQESGEPNLDIGPVLFSVLQAIRASGSLIKEIMVEDTMRTSLAHNAILDAQKKAHGRQESCSALTAPSVQYVKMNVTYCTGAHSLGESNLHICNSGGHMLWEEDHALNVFFAHLPNLTRLHLTMESWECGAPHWIPNSFGRHLVDIALQLSPACLPRSETSYYGIPDDTIYEGWHLLVSCLRRSPKLQRLCLEKFSAPTLNYVQTVLSKIMEITSLEVFELTEAKVADRVLCFMEGCSMDSEAVMECRDWMTKDNVKDGVEAWREWAHLHRTADH
jgi:hypothetical protein